MGKQIAADVTDANPAPVVLKFEKVGIGLIRNQKVQVSGIFGLCFGVEEALLRVNVRKTDGHRENRLEGHRNRTKGYVSDCFESERLEFVF